MREFYERLIKPQNDELGRDLDDLSLFPVPYMEFLRPEVKDCSHETVVLSKELRDDKSVVTYMRCADCRTPLGD
jgi:ribosomal protein S27E